MVVRMRNVLAIPWIWYVRFSAEIAKESSLDLTPLGYYPASRGYIPRKCSLSLLAEYLVTRLKSVFSHVVCSSANLLKQKKVFT